MLISPNEMGRAITSFIQEEEVSPYLLIAGDAHDCLRSLPGSSVETVITSPPYWNQREYSASNSIGAEEKLEDYVESLLHVFAEIKRVLKPTGSFWLNLGDTYREKSLCGVPWRVALALQDKQQWLLRNSVVWNKLKGYPDNSKDKLRNTYEFVFHFVKQKNFYYDIDAVRKNPRSSLIRNGSVVTATGVTGVNYRRQIQRSTSLSEQEKADALQALERALQRVIQGKIPDFRMVIRGQQRTTHSNSTKVSGRAAELERKGFYILEYSAEGSKPGDVWEVVPEDQWRIDQHYAPFPEELCVTPIKLTCPPRGIVLDPFAGTCTAILVAVKLGRKGIGIDISKDYLETALSRLSRHQLTLFNDEQIRQSSDEVSEIDDQYL